jgi:predicted dehydrogenase
MRYGLVGTGFWATEVHAVGLAAEPEVDFMGVWGRNVMKATALANRHEVRVYSEPRRMFEDVDAVAFAVPPHVQAPLALTAVAAGCHLLLEKPLAFDVPTADAIVAAASDAGVASVVFVTPRFVPSVTDWITQVQERGGWHGAQATWLSSIYHEGSPFSSSKWRRERGALWDVGPHALAMTIASLGPISEITAVRGREDLVHLVARHHGGTSSHAVVSLTAPTQARASTFTVYGEQGWAQMPAYDSSDVPAAYSVAVRALHRAARTGTPHQCDVRFARDLVSVLSHAERALI